MTEADHDGCDGHSHDGLNPLELGQQCLKQGDAAGAVRHLTGALKRPGGETVDTHLVLAEALWQEAGAKGTLRALPHYEAAAALAAAAGDATKESMVCIGHGFALNQLGETAAARSRFLHARSLAEKDGNADGVRFIERMMEQVGGAESADGTEAVQTTWRSFAEAMANGKPAVLFLCGTLAAPADERSQRGVTKLRAAGCTRLDILDVCDPGAGVPDGLQGIAQSSQLVFPQLYLRGAQLESWLELAPERLRELLEEAGAPLGEPHVEPCHGTAAFADGLEPWEVALVQLVSERGAGNWEGALSHLREKGLLTGELEAMDVASIEIQWERLAPLVREKLEKQPEMPCGHSCNTCPTRHDCQLHDAVGDKSRDIEDLA
jgi:glutaredoxin-related protein